MININNKGFTMVELLATIVILGIVLSLSVATIFRTIQRGRNKTYISDASNMVAQAEYLAKSNPADIGIPNENECIVIFLSKFKSEDFEYAPNGGEYDKDISFVIYKNNGLSAKGNVVYEFSGMLVEKMKKGGDYQGVELTTGENLSKGKGKIITVNPSDLADIESYIGSVWPGYCSNVAIKR